MPSVAGSDGLTPGRRVALRRALRCALFAAALLLVEGAARVVEAASPPKRGMLQGAPSMDLEDPECFEPDADLLWRLRPDTEMPASHPALAGVRTNRWSLRGAAPGPKVPGELRVVCLGDSITFGLGLREEDTMPSALERVLASAPELRGRKVSVVNAGVPGYSIVQGERLLARLAPLEPDVVVVWFGMNDAKPAGGGDDEARLRGPPPAPVRALSHLAVFRLAGRAAGSGRPRVPVDRFASGAASIAASFRCVFVRGNDRLPRTEAKLRHVIDLCRAAGATRVVADGSDVFPFAPASHRALPVPLRTSRDGPVTLHLAPPARNVVDVPVADIEAWAAEVAAWKRDYDDRAETLPDPVVTPLAERDITHDTIMDNCHLQPEGARIAARAIAAEVIRAAARPSPAPK